MFICKRNITYVLDEYNFTRILTIIYHKYSFIENIDALTPRYHFHSLYRCLDISCVITERSSHLYIACDRTQTGNPWIPKASR